VKLGGGLVLRAGRPADREVLAEGAADILRDSGEAAPDQRVRAWMLDEMSGAHPTTGPSDFTVVQEEPSGRIVSAMCLISQTWTFGGVPFAMGRPEAVWTLPEYRNRGLIRRQFEVLHSWSAARGQLLQAITGIPFFYRQFGYEMTVDLGGGRIAPVSELKPPGEPKFTLRRAGEGDIPFLLELDRITEARALLACRRDAAQWRWDLSGMSEQNIGHMVVNIIERDGKAEGVVAHEPWPSMGRYLQVTMLELARGVSWLAVAPDILRDIGARGRQLVEATGKEFAGLRFQLPSGHPYEAVLHDRAPIVRCPYAWYLRVPDLVAFLLHVRPALEAQLDASPVVGHCGELKVSFYRSGLRLTFAAGRLKTIEAWHPTPSDEGHAAFPGTTFLQLLFGHRTLDALRAEYADCWADGDPPRALLNALFPKRMSDLNPLY
jgi:hypothetical protein